MQLPDHLASRIGDGETHMFGELILSRCGKTRRYKACHLADRDTADGELTPLESVPAVREMAKFDAKGEYRPLKTAPTLKCGWVIFDPEIASFYSKLDAIYPAAFAQTIRYFADEIAPVPLRETLNRQTGMYRFAGNVTDNQANQIMRNTCAGGCLRKIAWPIDDQCPVSRLPEPRRSIPLVCTEACTFAVSEARRLAREAYDKANPVSGA